MANRKAISRAVLRLLYAHSGNQCAFPNCYSPIFEDNGLLTGEICHIEAYGFGGARYNVSQTNDERNSVDNLLLLCSRHHKIIDANSSEFTVEALREMKEQHERRFSAKTLELNVQQLNALRTAQSEFWKRIDAIDHVEPIVPDLKMVVDQSKSIEELIQNVDELLDNIRRLFADFSVSDDRLNEEIRMFLGKLGYDLSMYDKVPYCENPFINRNWESHALAATNIINHLTMVVYQLIIRLLEKSSIANGTQNPLLPSLREKFIELQKCNYYAD